MDPHQPTQQPHQIKTDIPPLPHHLFPRTANSTPISSPGLFSPSNPRPNMALPTHAASDATTTPAALSSPYLHPLQTHKVRETHKALVDLDLMTGRKIINQYEVIEEIGRGMHGKVKLARNLENGENVAIKIVARFSKKRRLGKVTALSPQDKTKKEIAILKKIRHPNVVALLEIIDDPELKKIYIVLEHVERGEVVWRKKGIPWVCAFERRRIEREMRGEVNTDEEDQYLHLIERRSAINELKRAKMQQNHKGPEDYWSIEFGAADEDDAASLPQSLTRNESDLFHNFDLPYSNSHEGSRATSRVPSRVASLKALSRAATPLPSDSDISSIDGEYLSNVETPGPLRSQPGSSTALDTVVFAQDAMFRGRSPSMADSIISHMSSVDFGPQPHDPYADDFSYVPCFSIEDARATFRDTVLGLEYLHYEGIVHRDIKPANLLWTKDHRVKISDFGVSYFGRPIRDGELDEFVSESEARDFDDDLELAKTVGTPAFFAPELCYTDIEEDQPKISEQIDVWSLGVTLYCLIYARIPFMAEDEFQMFRKIAKDEAYIPRRRLKPVHPHTNPSSTSLYKRVGSAPYRDDNEIVYEEVDDLLYDLLRKMLTKNPEKRIRLREVKRHPWVVQGIPDLMAWIDDTDPSRRTSGRKIQVDEREITRAVVPLTFLERARSAVKKAVGKVIPQRPDRGENQSRRRAISSAASSAGDSVVTTSSTPHNRDSRRRSLRGDDYFVGSGHPLTQSLASSPQGFSVDSDAVGDHDSVSVGGDSHGYTSGSATDFNTPPDVTYRPSSRTSTSSGKAFLQKQTHLRTRSINNNSSNSNNTFLTLTPTLQTSYTTPSTPAADFSPFEDPIAALRKSRDMRSNDDSSRSRSVDRGLFASPDKRAEAKVSISTAIAPGNVELPKRPTPLRVSASGSHKEGSPLASPMFFSPKALKTYQHDQPKSDPNIYERLYCLPNVDERPLTAQRVQSLEKKQPPPTDYQPAKPESSSRAEAQLFRRHQREGEEEARRLELVSSQSEVNPSLIPCPPSPSEDLTMRRPLPPTRSDTTGTVITSSPASATNSMTPLTSPSDVTSPISIANLGAATEDSQIFRSDPSLPALLSGASSVSADAEGDFLLRPGSIDHSPLIDTTDSLTPPAMTKEPVAGFPLEELGEEDNQVHLHIGHDHSSVFSSRAVEDDDDSDSDDGLVMAKSKRKLPPRDSASQSFGHIKTSPRRRDTQTSVGSTDTAKKFVMHSE